ncbi:MAG: hypothetical protein Q8P80_00425 [Candidatus Levybacteria bacterium]|nr:hypothetical protein [Candidatus Levybacteria bacterium]
MDNATFQAIKDVLVKNESLGIVVGKNPSIDDMGAALSLYLSLKQLNKNVSIASPQEPIVELSSLVGINKVKKNLDSGGGGGGDLVVSFPYREGEIEKVSYTLEEGFLNIVVKAGDNGLSFSDSEVKFKRGGGYPTALFIVGTPRLADLGELFDPSALKDTTVINIDNKSENQGFGDIVYVSPAFSSVCEQMVNLLSFLGVDLETDIAQNLLHGISFATDNFQNPKTSFSTFETAAALMKKGAVRARGFQAQPVAGVQQQVQAQGGEDSLDQLWGPLHQTEVSQGITPQNTPGSQRPWNRGQQQLRRPNPFVGQRQFPSSQGGSVSNQPEFPESAPASLRTSSLGQTSQQGGPASPGGQKINQPAKKAPVQNNDDEEAPEDWLTPKIYKGSTNI